MEPVDETGNYVIPCTAEDKLLLARLIQAEAEGEPFAGKVAVGAVVVNRVLSAGFPDTIEEVIFQQGQFECVANGRLDAIDLPDTEAVKAAEAALRGEDPTGGAVFFYAPRGATGRWLSTRPVKAVIGRHLFLS